MASPVPSSFSQGFELPRPDPADFPPEIIPTIGNIEIPLDKRFPTSEFDQLPECSQLLEQAFTSQNFKAYRLTHPGGMDKQAQIERRYKVLVSRRLIDLSEETIARFKAEPAEYTIFEEGYNAKMYTLKCKCWVELIEQMIEDFDDLCEDCDDWASCQNAYNDVHTAMLDLHEIACEVLDNDEEPVVRFSQFHKIFPSNFVESIQDSIYWN